MVTWPCVRARVTPSAVSPGLPAKVSKFHALVKTERRYRQLQAGKIKVSMPSFGIFNFMKIAIGSDHAGFRYKEAIKELLRSLRHEVKDFGTHSEEPVDYPLFIRPVAEAVARGEFERGVVLGGSGNGEAITANRVKGVRCALCWNVESARLGRQHNNANVISIGERMVSPETALEIARVWLTTPFEGGRHQRRIDLIDAANL